MKIIDLMVHSQIYIALGAVSFVYLSYIILGLNFDLLSFFVAFSFGWLIYLTNKKGGLDEDIANKLKHVDFISKYGNKLFYFSLFLFFVSLFLLFLNKSYWLILMLVFLTILNALYGVKFVPKKISKKVGFSRFKEILFFKNIMTAISWSTPALFPVLYYNINIPSNILFIMFFLGIRFFINTTFFDVKDIIGDKKCGIRTIPTTYGLKKTKLLLSSLNIFSFIFVILCVYLKQFPNFMLVVNLTSIYAFYYILNIDNKKADIKFLSDIVADGELILLSILAILGLIAFPLL